MQPLLNWEEETDAWHLYLTLGKRRRCVATVFPNATWFTWDQDGVGGENAQNEDVAAAKIAAGGSAICQGFI